MRVEPAGRALLDQEGDVLGREPLLEVDDLRLDFLSRRGHVRAVRGVSLAVFRGESLAVVGESGSGKSVTARAMMGLLDPTAQVVGGDVRWKGQSMLHGPGAGPLGRRVRGNEVSMVFQDPVTSLNPLLTVGTQIGEVVRNHRGASRREARARAIELLDMVGVRDPQRRVDDRPYQFSGGMCQRVLVAMALACEPELIIADEPTTALDVTIQAQILELLGELQAALGVAVLLITHDLGVVAEFADRLAVMYAGRIVETGTVTEVFSEPTHPYTAGLLRAMPRADRVRGRLEAIDGAPPDLRVVVPGCPFEPRCPEATSRCSSHLLGLVEMRPGRAVACHNPLVEPTSRSGGASPEDGEKDPGPSRADARDGDPLVRVDGLTVEFVRARSLLGRPRSVLRAVDQVTLEILPGETLALVGESGSGKSTLGRTVLRRLDPVAGTIHFDGRDITHLRGERLRRLRQEMQMVFQDPYGSLNSKKRILDVVAEPLVVHGLARGVDDARARVIDLLALTGMPPDAVDRYPREFSGGQLQRVGIARALALEPKFLVADEPVAALDTSIQAQVVNLLQDLQRRLGLTYLFISHDLAVVRHIAHRIAIMYAGQIVECAPCDEVFEQPRHPYTQALLAAVPIPDPSLSGPRARRAGVSPEPGAGAVPGQGCKFFGRCPIGQVGICDVTAPPTVHIGEQRTVACHFVDETAHPAPSL